MLEECLQNLNSKSRTVFRTQPTIYDGTQKKSTQIYFYDKSIYYFKISDVSSELHSLSSFHLYNIIHKNSYFCQGGYRDKLQ